MLCLFTELSTFQQYSLYFDSFSSLSTLFHCFATQFSHSKSKDCAQFKKREGGTLVLILFHAFKVSD